MKSFLKNVLSTTVGMLIGTILSLFIFVGFIGVLTKMGSGAPTIVEKSSILHLRLRGQLVEKHRPLDFDFVGDRSIFSEDRTLGLWELTRAIDLAAKDNRISGIYLEIRDFDAGWAGITALRRHIEGFAKSGKWVYAYADRYDEMSYYLATAANQVFIQPHGDIEFNGLAMNPAFLKGLFEKLEMEPRIFRVGKFKAAIEPLVRDQMSEENRRQTQELVDDIWKVVRDTVSKSRKMEEKRVDEIAAGLEAVSAAQAKSVGLVHETIFEDELEDRMRDFTVGKDEEIRLVSAGQLLRNVQETPPGNGKKIALIFAEGEITSGPGSRDSIGSEGLRQDILEATEDPDVGAIVLRINSPGGDALASDVIWHQLMVSDKKVPVVVSMGDVAASGGYYIASAGRYILAEPATITGSIGVFGVMFYTQKFFNNKAGIRFDRVVTHPYADIGDANRPMTEKESRVIQNEVERVYARFLDVVQEGRGYEKRSDLENIAEGRVWSGKRAKELGLVDELGGLEQAIDKAREFAKLDPKATIEIFPKDVDPFMQFLERFTGDTFEGLTETLVQGILGEPRAKQLRELSRALPATGLKDGIHARLPFEPRIR